MSFCVAAQSAAFYFLACTPCNQVRHHHKAAQKAKKEREEKARIVAEQPHLYQHPDPFSTNPYWAEEIRMGPALPKKGRGGDSASKNASQRGLTVVSRDGGASIGTGSSQIFGISEAGPSPSPIPPNTATSPTDTSRIGSGPTIVAEEDMMSTTLSKTASVSTGDDWNLKRYQREDEELWGTWTGHKLMDAIKQAGTTAGRFVESKLGIEREVTEEDRYNFYFSPRNPPVNDYHPPVVSSKPAHKDGLRWMLQPPPPAKIMEGKVPVSRSASMMSTGSRRTTTTVNSLGRQVGERAFEARLRSGESPFDTELYSVASLNRTRSRRAATGSTRTKSRRTARTASFSADSEDSEDGYGQRRRRPSYRTTATPEVESDDEDIYVPRSLDIFGNHNGGGAAANHAAQKPRLSTILSSEATAVTITAAPKDTSSSSSSSASQQLGDGRMNSLGSALQDTTNATPSSAPTSSEGSTDSKSTSQQENGEQQHQPQKQHPEKGMDGIDARMITLASTA